MEAGPVKTPIIIGSYPFRGQAQVLRLVCEYLHYPYIDRFFNPDEWKEFKEKETKDWVISDIPFLQHEDFVMTGNFAMITYVIDICDRHDLEGRTLEDKTKMDFMKSKSLKDEMIQLFCDSKVTTVEQETEVLKKFAELFEEKVCLNFESHERECTPNNYYLGYLSMVDFGLYEFVNVFREVFPERIAKFTKLAQLRDRVAAIPEIAAYEASERSQTEKSPTRYFIKHHESKQQSSRNDVQGLLKEKRSIDASE